MTVGYLPRVDRGAVFIDVDENNRDAIDHFKTHADDAIFVRRSSGGNLHAIVFPYDALDFHDCCKEFGDQNYSDRWFFDNKGERWASPFWKNVLTGDLARHDPTVVINVLADSDRSYEFHYFKTIATFYADIGQIIGACESVYYTFNLCLWRGGDHEVFNIGYDEKTSVKEKIVHYGYKNITNLIKVTDIRQKVAEFMNNKVQPNFWVSPQSFVDMLN